MRRTILIDVLSAVAVGALAIAVWRLWWLAAFTDSNEELSPAAAETVASLSHAATVAVYAAMASIVLLWAAGRWLIGQERRRRSGEAMHDRRNHEPCQR